MPLTKDFVRLSVRLSYFQDASHKRSFARGISKIDVFNRRDVYFREAPHKRSFVKLSVRLSMRFSVRLSYFKDASHKRLCETLKIEQTTILEMPLCETLLF